MSPSGISDEGSNRRFESLSTFTQGQASNQGVGAMNATVNPVASNFYSALRTRSVVEPEFIYTDFPRLDNLPNNLNIDYSKILNKPFFVKNITWDTSQVHGVIVDHVSVPFDIIVNELSKYPFNTSVLYRAKISLIYQVAATPMHQGTLLIGAVPNGTHLVMQDVTMDHTNKLMAAPHGFLYANESTSVRIQVPFYSNTKLINTDIQGNTVQPNGIFGNYAEVVAMVMNSLSQPTTAARTVTVSVHAVFDDLEFFVPHVDTRWVTEGLMEIGSKAVDGVFGVARSAADGLADLGKHVVGDGLDWFRGMIRKYTGLHNPNDPRTEAKHAVTFRQNPNCVDIPTRFEKLDPYGDYARITQDTLFDTIVDEMDLKTILSKPMYINTFRVSTTDATGTLLFSRPITPMQSTGIDKTVLNPVNGREERVAVINNNFQLMHMLSRYWRGGINLHIQSNMTNFHFCKLQVARNYSPVVEQLTGNPEFTDIQNLMVETLEFSGGGQVQTVSLPYISPMEVLPISTDWTFNALQHGMYYIYLAQPLVTNGAVPTDITFNVYISADEDFQHYGYGANSLGWVSEFIAESAVMQPISDQTALTNPGFNTANLKDEIMRPIVSARDHLRRMNRVLRGRYSREDIASAGGNFTIPLESFIEPCAGSVVFPLVSSTARSPNQFMRSLYLGLQGGVRLKAVISGTTSASMWYVPPGYTFDPEATTLDSYWTPTVPFSRNGGINQSFDLNIPNNQEPSWSATVPVIDRANYVVAASGATIFKGPETSVLMGGCELEAHIPNLSPYRFVGTPEDRYHKEVPYLTTARGNMGSIVFSFGDPSLLSPGTGNIDTEIELALYMSFDDEARCGYQVVAPAFFVPAYQDRQLTVDNKFPEREPPLVGVPAFQYFTRI